jgi:triacylglycerol esterase/lipase EstA (alpha/beta hydrolase family)
VLGSEAVATLREVVLMPRDIATVVPNARPGDDVVVLVHGFMASAGVFRPMRARLEREVGARVATFTHAPGQGVKRIAQQLSDLMDRIPLGTRIHIVGHSLGGLVARWYVQEMGGHARVAQTISLASPFGGSHVARALPVLVGADLHPSCEVLTRLRSHAHVGEVPHTSFVAGADRLVWPTQSAVFARGEAVFLPRRGHNTVLFDEEVLRRVVDLVRAYQFPEERSYGAR